MSDPPLKAIYSLAELSRMLGMHHQQVHRLMTAAGIEMTLSGRSVLIPLSEIEAKLPKVLESAVLVAAYRQRASRTTGTAGTYRTRGDGEL